MTKEQIERNRKFLADLRDNENQALEEMRDEGGGRCCLCVAYDSAQEMGASLPDLPCSSDGSLSELPPTEIASFYGWFDANPRLNNGERLIPASAVNDNEVSHKDIADMFEATFPELKEN